MSSTISEVFANVILYRLGEYLWTTDNQFGFKSGHSTDLCVYTLTECIEYLKRRSTSVYVAFLDGLIAGLGSSTVGQVLKYTKYPKYIPSTSTGQVLIFFKKYLSTSSTFISSISTSTSTHIKIVTLHYNCVLYVGKLWQSITSLSPEYLFVLKSGWTYRVK